MKTKKSHYLLAITLVLYLLLSGGSVFAASDGGLEIPPGSVCEPTTETGTPLDGELVVNYINFRCSAGTCGPGGADVAHVKATLRLNYSKFNNNTSKMQTYTFHEFLGKNVSINDTCEVTSLIINKFTGPILKQLFNISDPASGVSIKLREAPAFTVYPTFDLNADPAACKFAGTCIFATDKDPLELHPIVGFTSVVDFKAVVLGL